MAASYLPPRYLIGPRLFPTFMLVIRIVLVVLGVLALIGLGVDLGQAGQSVEAWLRVLGENITGFFIGAISALGNIVLVSLFWNGFCRRLRISRKIGTHVN